MFQRISFQPNLALSVALLAKDSCEQSVAKKSKGFPSDLRKALPDLNAQYRKLITERGSSFDGSVVPGFDAILEDYELSVSRQQLKLRAEFCSDFFSTRLRGAAGYMRAIRGMEEERYPSYSEVQVEVVFPGVVQFCDSLPSSEKDKGLRLVYPGFLTDSESQFPVCVSLLFQIAKSFHWRQVQRIGVESRGEDLANLNQTALGDALAAAVEVQWLSEDNADKDAWMSRLGIS